MNLRTRLPASMRLTPLSAAMALSRNRGTVAVMMPLLVTVWILAPSFCSLRICFLEAWMKTLTITAGLPLNLPLRSRTSFFGIPLWALP